MERVVSDLKYENGCADAYDPRGMLLCRIRCDAAIGYGDKGFVVKRNGVYEVHQSNGVLAMAPLIEYNYNRIKTSLRKDYLAWLCR